jgi:hypothetical protein
MKNLLQNIRHFLDLGAGSTSDLNSTAAHPSIEVGRLYSTVEAGRLVGLSERAVREACQRGRIKAKKINDAWCIVGQSLIDYMRG